MRQYILVDRQEQMSRLNHVRMWRLTFYSLDDGHLFETTVDASYRNFRSQGWDHVVEDPSPWGVYEGLRRSSRRTAEGMPVLTADSGVRLVWRADDLQQALRLVQADQDQRNPTAFGRMFDAAV